MSRYPSPDTGSPPLAPEKERVPTKRVALILTMTLTIFSGSVVLVWRALLREEQKLLPNGPPAIPTELDKPKVGIVEQRLFSLSRHGLEQRRQQLERLRNYGWVDRERGIIHIPIEQAIDQVVEEAKR